MFKILQIIFLTVFLVSCSSKNMSSVRNDDIHNIIEEYKLSSGDLLSIKIFGDETLTGEYKVNQNGELFLPLIGHINVAHKSLKEVQNILEQTLSESYLNDPNVYIDIIKYKPIYVLGEVRIPGEFEYVPKMNIAHAIALARGFTPRGNQEYVEIFRDGDSAGVSYNFTPNIYVLPGDTIIIKPRFF